MQNLKAFAHLDIDWALGPEDAVTLYLEWGNNNWRGEHAPVRSAADVAHYFVVDTWGDEPMVRLIRRNSEQAVELVSIPLPPELRSEWDSEYGTLKGIFAPNASTLTWLRQQLEES